jgi:hypothetical protein
VSATREELSQEFAGLFAEYQTLGPQVTADLSEDNIARLERMHEVITRMTGLAKRIAKMRPSQAPAGRSPGVVGIVAGYAGERQQRKGAGQPGPDPMSQ